MNDDNRHHWHDLILLALVALCLLLALLELWSVAYDPRFTETPEGQRATPVDTTWRPPAPIAGHCEGQHCIEKGPVDWYAEVGR